jgi:hypothetical protein
MRINLKTQNRYARKKTPTNTYNSTPVEPST